MRSRSPGSAPPRTPRRQLADRSQQRHPVMRVGQETGQTNRLRNGSIFTVKSMTDDGPPRTPDGDAALVEALGWFAGWNSGRRYLMTA
jgi:hypothetical protein